MARSSLCGDTGNGTTVAFATGITAAYKIRRVTLPTVNGERIDCSDIATAPGPRKYTPGDLFDVEAIELEIIVDTFDPIPALHTNCGLVTVTFPLRTGETTPMTYAATCFVIGVTPLFWLTENCKSCLFACNQMGQLHSFTRRQRNESRRPRGNLCTTHRYQMGTGIGKKRLR